MHKICCQLRFYAVCIHFPDIHIQPLFASKPTFARIDFLRPDGRLVDIMALTMLKSMLKR